MGLENLEEMEFQLEVEENQAEQVEDKLEEVQERIETIREAISSLENDSEVAQSLERNALKDAETELESVNARKEELTNSINATLEEIGELQAENEQTSSALAELSQMQEDVSEAEEIVQSRRNTLEASAKKARELLDKLQG